MSSRLTAGQGKCIDRGEQGAQCGSWGRPREAGHGGSSRLGEGLKEVPRHGG